MSGTAISRSFQSVDGDNSGAGESKNTGSRLCARACAGTHPQLLNLAGIIELEEVFKRIRANGKIASRSYRVR